jgi:pyruvate dehydrogenase E1 component alpha subunit
MHVADLSKGMFGANGVVGGGIPMSTGLALAFKYKGTDQVSVSFFGDGASNQGTFHESLNLAGIWKLPVIFFCENNGYGEDTPIAYHMACKNVSERAAGYAIPGITIDGSDVLQVYRTTREAVDRARRGGGPTLIEAKVYYKYAHYEGMPTKYKTKEYVRLQEEKDPVKVLTDFMIGSGISNTEQLHEIQTRVGARIEEAWQFAVNSPLPKPEEAIEDVYSHYP